MYKKFNIFLGALAVFGLLSIGACSSNSDEDSSDFKRPVLVEEETNSNQMVLASATENLGEAAKDEKSSVEVYTLKSVSKATKGKAIDFTWNDGKKDISFAKYTKGKVVFLNFWGTWCPPCRREIPDIIQISKDLKDKDFVVVGIALEHNPATAFEQVKTYAQKNNFSYINIVDAKKDLAIAYGGINNIPASYFIDKNGNIKDMVVGSKSKAEILKIINKVMQ